MTPANQWSIIHNWRKVGTMADEGTDDSSKEPRTTSKDLRVPLALVKVYDSEITKKLCKNGMHGRLLGWKTVETKESTGSSGICWRDKCRTWEGGRAWCKTQYFMKNNGSHQTAVAAWWAVAAVLLQDLDDLLNLIKQGTLLSTRETELKHTQAQSFWA